MQRLFGNSEIIGIPVRNGGHDCAFQVPQGLKVNGPFTQVEALFGNGGFFGDGLGHGGDSDGGGNMFDLSFENKDNRLYWLCPQGNGGISTEAKVLEKLDLCIPPKGFPRPEGKDWFHPGAGEFIYLSRFFWRGRRSNNELTQSRREVEGNAGKGPS